MNFTIYISLSEGEFGLNPLRKFSCLRRILRPGSFSTNIITSVFVLLMRITGILKRSVPSPGQGPSGIPAINVALIRKVPNAVREQLKRGISINLDFFLRSSEPDTCEQVRWFRFRLGKSC